MNAKLKYGIQSITLSSLIVVLSACGGSSGGVSTNTDNQDTTTPAITDNTMPGTTPVQTIVDTSNDFTFPAVTETNGEVQVTIPAESAPEFSARRVLKSGEGNVIEFGDPVVLKYKMFSWNTGDLVENTDTVVEPVTVRAGLTDGAPQFLTKSLPGRRVGDQLQLVFESGMEDLPEYLEADDAYVLVVDIL